MSDIRVRDMTLAELVDWVPGNHGVRVEYRRLQAVVDAARAECINHSSVRLGGLTISCRCDLCLAVSTLDGEPRPTCKAADGAGES